MLTLGSGALAGSGLPIDREAMRRELGWVDLPEELCTGSSMMPQKKNADFLELARGASSILIGNSTALNVLQKGLPSSYNRDLQWDKEPLFRSVRLVEELLPIFEVLFKRTQLRADRARKSILNDQLAATDLAEALVAAGVPFRDAHERVGKLVREAEALGVGGGDGIRAGDDGGGVGDGGGSGRSLRSVPNARALEILGSQVKNWKALLDPARSVGRKRTSGSTRPAEVDRQIVRWEKELHAFF